MKIKHKKKTFWNDEVAIDAIIEEFAQQSDLTISGYDILQVFQRPFSIVFKIHIHFAEHTERVYYLKYYQREAKKNKPGVVERDFNTTQFWFEHFKEHEEFNVIKPVYYNTEKFILISEESKGRNLSQLINTYGQFLPSLNAQKKLVDMLALVGKWLRYFQSIPIEESYEEISLDYFLNYMEIRLNHLVDNKKLAFDSTLKKQVIAFIERQWAKTTAEDLKYCYIHSDLSLSNVLIYKNSITVLDFNEKETGLIYKDLTRFYHQLALLLYKPTFDKELVKKLQAAFLEAYGMPYATHKPLFKIYYLIHMLNHLNKNSRYWEHGFIENLYNRWVVKNSLRTIKSIITKKDVIL